MGKGKQIGKKCQTYQPSCVSVYLKKRKRKLFNILKEKKAVTEKIQCRSIIKIQCRSTCNKKHTIIKVIRDAALFVIIKI